MCDFGLCPCSHVSLGMVPIPATYLLSVLTRDGSVARLIYLFKNVTSGTAFLSSRMPICKHFLGSNSPLKFFVIFPNALQLFPNPCIMTAMYRSLVALFPLFVFSLCLTHSMNAVFKKFLIEYWSRASACYYNLQKGTSRLF